MKKIKWISAILLIIQFICNIEFFFLPPGFLFVFEPLLYVIGGEPLFDVVLPWFALILLTWGILFGGIVTVFLKKRVFAYPVIFLNGFNIFYCIVRFFITGINSWAWYEYLLKILFSVLMIVVLCFYVKSLKPNDSVGGER